MSTTQHPFSHPDELSKFIGTRTYFRWLDDEERRETCPEALLRYLEWLDGQCRGLIPPKIRTATEEHLLKLSNLPSMRLLWSAGPSVKRNNIVAYNCFSGDTKILTKNKGLIPLQEALGSQKVYTSRCQWEPAEIKSFGMQETYEITMGYSSYNTKIRATSGHRWILEDGTEKTTFELEYGDKIPYKRNYRSIDIQSEDYKLGIIHGLVFGDGTALYKKKRFQGYVIRLCSDAQDLLPWFNNYEKSYPKTYNGDPVVYLFDDFAKTHDLKSLPPEHESREYMIGFFRGWFAADGHISKEIQSSICATRERVEWLQRVMPKYGIYTQRVEELPKVTNYGARKNPSYRIFLQRASLSEGDFIINRKRIRFKPLYNKTWTIRNIDSQSSKLEEVFCAQVPSTGNFTIEEGILTGNCSYLPIKDLFCFAELMYILMCGTGVGYSVERQYVYQLPTVAHQLKEDPYSFIVEDSKEGWADSIREGLVAWTQGREVDFDFSQIRPLGARLKVGGGRASGPAPLQHLLQYIREVILKAQGKKLEPIEVHDICCNIADIVQVGGVRRAAMIAFFDVDDDKMSHCKHYPEQFDPEKGINPWRARANNSVALVKEPSELEFMKLWTALKRSGTGEPGLFFVYNIEQYLKRRSFNLEFRCNPCGEIILKPFQFCNLTSVIIRPSDTFQDLIDKVEVAVWMGVIQATLTKFKYIRKEWKENCEEERLLGVSLNGQLGNIKLMSGEKLEILRDFAIKTCRKACKIFGINMSAAVTCGKPEGTGSLLVGCNAGMKPDEGEYMIRRVRISSMDPLCMLLFSHKAPMFPEVDEQLKLERKEITIEQVRTWVVEFPVKRPRHAIFKENFNAEDQLDWYLKLQENWCEHNQSCTIHVHEGDWMKLGAKVWDARNKIVAVSFLPHASGYSLMPEEAISEEEYRKRKAVFPKINYSELSKFEKEDMTTGELEYACMAGECTI